MPFVPVALLVVVNDSPNRRECFVVVCPFGSDLNGRTIRRQVGNLSDFLQIDISAHQDGFAVLANSLHAARPAKNNLCATIRTSAVGWVILRVSPQEVALELASGIGSEERFGRNVRSDDASDGHRVAPTTSCSTPLKSHSARGTQQNRFRQSEPNSGKVWQARWDSASRHSPVIPPVLRKLVPVGFADRPKLQVANDPLEQDCEYGQVGRDAAAQP